MENTQIQKIKGLFARRIDRRIEEIIKVDQTDEQIIRDELREYHLTDAIRGRYSEIFERYSETPNKPHEGIGVWISGFFGSGKSSFAKLLGLALENRNIMGEPASKLFAARAGDNKITALLGGIAERIPTEAVIFDVSTDRGIRSGNQTLTEISYRLFLKHLGYAEDLDLAELEITLEQKGELDAFKAAYETEFEQPWDENKDLISFSLGEASAVIHQLYPKRYATEDSWVQAAQDRADITPGKLAERASKLMGRRRPGRSLVFVIDEVGQFVARDVQKMLDLQAVVQNLGRIGRGKIWIVVTSQEKLTELVGGLDDRRVELARLMDRFPLQVHLEPSDISEVTSKRVLSKNADGEKLLRELYTAHSGRLLAHTRLSAGIKLPALSDTGFMDLYPLLPYQIDLIIQVVSGLRTQGGTSKHVGGANRTIIKLAQQLLIHDAVGLAEQSVGKLARIDHIYDLVAGNIASEIRGKIADIPSKVEHRYAQPAAKAICLFQYVKSIHGTAENIAVGLHPGVSDDSVLSEVKAALQELVDSLMVRVADGQYRIPTPAEDDWETTRGSLGPKPGDVNRIHTEIVSGLWEPRPSHNWMNVKTFKAGLVLNGRSVFEEDIPFHVNLAQEGSDLDEQTAVARTRSQSERKSVFWVAALDQRVDRETVQVFRSKEILARKSRTAKTRDETALVAEEKVRLRSHEGQLKGLIRNALLNGFITFRGNDRSPEETASSVRQVAKRVLTMVLPEVFGRFEEGAARVTNKDLNALMQSENLRGLTPVFTQLNLVRDEKGQPVLNTATGPLKEVVDRIENKTSYGETATGRYLATEFAKEPFGWNLDVIRLFAITLLRAGKIKATSKGMTIESALSVEARNTFSSNNLFRACSFQKKVAGTDIEDWLEAEGAFREVFGKQLPELQAAVIAGAIRMEVSASEDVLVEVLTTLRSYQLPGTTVLREALDEMRAIRLGGEDEVIQSFNATHNALRDAIRRGNELAAALVEPRLHDLARARNAVTTQWPFLAGEQDVQEALRARAAELEDLLAKETFFRELPTIEQHAMAIAGAYAQRFEQAVNDRAQAYSHALETLHGTDGWSELNQVQQERIELPLRQRAALEASASATIPFLRSELNACPQHLKRAILEMLELIEGGRLVTLNIAGFFGSRVENEEQLEAALANLRRECLKLLAADKKILVH